MYVESEKDFPELRKQISNWRKKFPEFSYDVSRIEHIIEGHIQEYGIALVYYRQKRKIYYLEKAQEHIDEINRVIATIEKLELMALLSRR